MRKVEFRRQGPPAKRRNWTRYWRRIVGLTWWVNVWKGKNTTIIRWLSISFFGRKWISIFVFVSFSAVNGISFSSAFSFGETSKMKNAFRSASSIHHKKVLVLVSVLRCKVLVLVLNTRLDLGLERILKSWSWSWKKSCLHHWLKVPLNTKKPNQTLWNTDIHKVSYRKQNAHQHAGSVFEGHLRSSEFTWFIEYVWFQSTHCDQVRGCIKGEIFFFFWVEQATSTKNLPLQLQIWSYW